MSTSERKVAADEVNDEDRMWMPGVSGVRGGVIIDAASLDKPLELDAQVAIVGSGAGGSVLASRLTQAGIRVVMLEAGPWVTKDQFNLREEDAFGAMYQDRGTRFTGDGSIGILQGRTAGGGTTINWTTCYRTPDHVLDHWARVHGVDGLTSNALEPHFEVIEKRLNISKWPVELANANNRKLLDGARKLGWQAAATKRNVKGCANSGYCGMGCPVDAKQGMHLTYLPDALEAGMTLIVNSPVQRLVREGAKATSIVARAHHPNAATPVGHDIIVRAQTIVVSGGALNSPALLLRSGLNANGRVGKRTFLHPVIGVLGRYKEPVQGFYGAPQSVASHEFARPDSDRMGVFLEAAPVHPVLAASVLPVMGESAQAAMADLAHLSALIALHIDGFVPGDVGGTVSLRPGGLPKLDYPISDALQGMLRLSHRRLAELTLAAGADWAMTLHTNPLRMRTAKDLKKLDQLRYGAHQHFMVSAHQMGGCMMGADPDQAVVDSTFRFRGIDNLFVVDGSVFPTSLGVNPSQTIYGLAHHAATFVGASVGVSV